MPVANFIVVIGTSAGGAVVLPELLRQLRPEMKIVVFVVLHMAKGWVAELFADRMQKHTKLKCKVATNGELMKRGHVYIAPSDHHLIIKKNKIALGDGPMENRYRPSIDTLFRSAAAAYDHRVIGIILTGMLEDGVSGMQAIKRSGGTCIIQTPNEAKYPDMPNAVLKNLDPDYIIPVASMGEAIANTIRNPPKKTKIPLAVRKEAEIAERVHVGMSHLKEIAEPSLLSCPDCGGGLWEITSDNITRYRCHVGHAFTENGLLHSMQATTESALWTALRIIEERRNLLNTLAEKEKTRGNKTIAKRYATRIRELDLQIRHLKQVLFNIESD